MMKPPAYQLTAGGLSFPGLETVSEGPHRRPDAGTTGCSRRARQAAQAVLRIIDAGDGRTPLRDDFYATTSSWTRLTRRSIAGESSCSLLPITTRAVSSARSRSWSV